MDDSNPAEPSEQDDPRRIAARFVDLWQDQVGALADDESLSEALENMLSVLTQAAPPGGAHTDSGNDGGTHIEPSAAGTGGPDGTARTAAPGAPPGDHVELADELRRRIAECQSRIAALES